MSHAAGSLHDFACAVLAAAGLAPRHRGAVAATLVEADLLGYGTHGMAMLPMFARQIEDGRMARDGAPRLIARHRQRALLDGERLPGPVVMRAAVELAMELARVEPVVSVSVRRSGNTACLASYLPPVAESGRIALLFVGNPDNAAVAPPGAAAGVYGTDPVAACIPTGADPVLFDFATSATSNRMVERALRAGTLLPCEALIDGSGQPSADPNCIGAGGAIAPMGGAHWGHKGFALALLNETLTGCLAGFGRARATQDGVPAGSACLLQLIDPEGFAGRAAFLAEMEALVRAVKSAPAAGGSSGPRLPGERAFALRRRQLREGVTLHPDVPPLLEELARHYGIPPPPRSPGGAQRASWTRQRGNPAA